MKKIFYLKWVAIVTLLFVMSCNKDNDTYKYEAMVPVYMSFDEFRQPPKSSPARNIKQSGKIYFKDNYIFINEVNEGIHVIDNANPSNPVKLVFYEITGNVDIAIRGDILFADSYIDLIALDISDLLNPLEIGRIENAFPEVLPLPADARLPIAYNLFDRSKGVIVDWEIKTFRDKGYGWWPGMWRTQGRFLMITGNPLMKKHG